MDPNNMDMDLPPDARTALLNLIGTTYAELKKVDKHIVSGSNNIAATRTDFNRLAEEAITAVAQAQHHPVQQPQPQPQLVPQPQLIPQPQVIPQPVIQQAISPENDPNQLEFDFYKKITPDDLFKKLSDIDSSLATILEKLNKVIKILNGDANKNTK
jgi:hypothetical protein